MKYVKNMELKHIFPSLRSNNRYKSNGSWFFFSFSFDIERLLISHARALNSSLNCKFSVTDHLSKIPSEFWNGHVNNWTHDTINKWFEKWFLFRISDSRYNFHKFIHSIDTENQQKILFPFSVLNFKLKKDCSQIILKINAPPSLSLSLTQINHFTCESSPLPLSHGSLPLIFASFFEVKARSVVSVQEVLQFEEIPRRNSDLFCAFWIKIPREYQISTLIGEKSEVQRARERKWSVKRRKRGTRR